MTSAKCLNARGQGSDPLFPFFSALLLCGEELETQMGTKNLLAEIEHLLESAPEEKMRLSPYLLRLIGDAGYAMHATDSLDLLQPSVRKIYHGMMNRGGPKYANFIEESNKGVYRRLHQFVGPWLLSFAALVLTR